MTSIHLSTESQSASAISNQSQPVNKYDDPERVRQRLEDLRRHHNESVEIYDRTQPIINEQIHEETLVYLNEKKKKETKTKSQKPRAPKRQRTTANTNPPTNNAVSSSAQPQNTAPPQLIQQSTQNTLQQHLDQGQQMQQIQQIPIYANHMQQQQQQTQPTLVLNSRPQQPIRPPHSVSEYHQPNRNYQTKEISSQGGYSTTGPTYAQQTFMPTQHMAPHNSAHPHSHIIQSPQYSFQRPNNTNNNQYSIQPMNQSHNGTVGVHDTSYGTKSYTMCSPHNGVTNHHYSHQHHPPSHPFHDNYTTLPKDLDFNLQAGLECDVDSLIKHEITVEGQLDFNHDLLLKLDNPYSLTQH